MKVLISGVIMLALSVSAYAEQPAAPPDMVISGEAVAKLQDQLAEFPLPLKYSSQLFNTVKEGLRPLPPKIEVPKTTELPKK